MSHVTYGWVILCMSHVTHEWVISHTNESSQIGYCALKWCLDRTRHFWHVYRLPRLCMTYVTHEWVMSHTNESSQIGYCALKWCLDRTRHFWHVYRLPRLCMTYDLCHIWMIYVPYERDMSHVNETCRTGDRALKWCRDRISNVWHVYQLPLLCICHMNETCQIWMRHVTYEWALLHRWPCP